MDCIQHCCTLFVQYGMIRISPALLTLPLIIASPPNVLIVLVDDMGYADIGPLGGSHTPNVDSLAEEGILFTQWISGASVCTPSRASIQTGRLPVRSGLADNIKRTFFDPAQAGGLPP